MAILALSGSVRQGSFNRSLLRAAIELAPPGLTFSFAEFGTFPIYSGDIEAEGTPADVVAFQEAVRAADALLIVSPEYNHSIPGGLKNAIDWASRGRPLPFRGKLAGVMGASDGMVGTARMQPVLRDVLWTLGVTVYPHPEVLVARMQDKVDPEGRLVDQKTREVVAKYMAGFAAWVAANTA